MAATVEFSGGDIPLDLAWNGPFWADVPTERLSHVRPESSSHTPGVEFKVVRDRRRIAVLFRVDDRFVRSTCQEFQGAVCRDSCVEWFVSPDLARGYLNFEVNCGGFLHLSHIEDPARLAGGGFRKFRRLSVAEAALVDILTSLPPVVEPEIAGPVVWHALIRVPFTLFERVFGTAGTAPGSAWAANFYKCADATSHPHWLSWRPLAERNFHRPQDFGRLAFAKMRNGG